MSLNRKTFIYSLVLTLTLAAIILAYLFFLLPSLYLENSLKSNIRASQAFHEAYLDQGEFPVEAAPNLKGSLILRFPRQGDQVDLLSAYGTISFIVKDPVLVKQIQAIKDFDFSQVKDQAAYDWDLDHLINTIKESLADKIDFSFQKTDYDFDDSSQRTKVIKKDKYYLFVSTLEDRLQVYTNANAISMNQGELIISNTPYSSSKIDDITQVVLSSLPLILLSLILLTALASTYFSRLIIRPVQALARHTRKLRSQQLQPVPALNLQTGDEIQDLSLAVDDMYQDLQETYQALQKQLEAQELFMRASSHQLKTPLASASLLVTSMMDGIGKYKDTQTYLPQVQAKIQEIQRLIEDLLVINRPLEKDKPDWIELSDLIDVIVQKHQIQADSQNKNFRIQGQSSGLKTKPDYLYKLLDNLINNALVHSPDHSDIFINMSNQALEIANPGHISEDLLDQIFQPFVTQQTHRKSGGLGLYIAQRFAKALDYNLTIQNQGDQVLARLVFG